MNDLPSIALYATQGGGSVTWDAYRRTYVWHETPADFPEFIVGEPMPCNWSVVPINQAARELETANDDFDDFDDSYPSDWPWPPDERPFVRDPSFTWASDFGHESSLPTWDEQVPYEPASDTDPHGLFADEERLWADPHYGRVYLARLGSSLRSR
jgi:hypothetical protein